MTSTDEVAFISTHKEQCETSHAMDTVHGKKAVWNFLEGLVIGLDEEVDTSVEDTQR